MSDRRPWPEGVPPLPQFVVLVGLRTKGKCRAWVVVDTYDESDIPILKRHEHTLMPFVITSEGRVIWANRTARALGIVPDAEQENGA